MPHNSPEAGGAGGGGLISVQLELTGNEVKEVSFACNLFLIN